MAEDGNNVGAIVLSVVAVILLFTLIMGLAGSVDIRQLKAQFRRKAGILCGLVCQFVLMPFVGFLMVKAFRPASHVGITLLILCSSSGGAYSNWWCSLFNADLALSVAMTAVSTIISAGMLPVNLTVYISLLGEGEEKVSIPWGPLMQGVVTVVLAIATGIFISTKKPGWTKWLTRIGNISGILMILLNVIVAVLPSDKKKEEKATPLWAKEGIFYLTVSSPFLVSLVLSLIISSLPCLGLSRPERIAITIEVCYQNVGIASAVALAAFNSSPSKRADAAAVPVIYGLVEAVALALFCLVAWKVGWTYAPAKDGLCTIISRSYQPGVVEVKSTRSMRSEDSAQIMERSLESVTVVQKHPLDGSTEAPSPATTVLSNAAFAGNDQVHPWTIGSPVSVASNEVDMEQGNMAQDSADQKPLSTVSRE